MRKKQLLFVGIFAVLVLVLSGVAVRGVHADNNKGNDEESNFGQTVSGETHGSIVSQVAREEESGENGSNTTSESVSIKQNGDFRVTGVKVNSVDVSSSLINVTLYGFSRTVNLSGATITGAGHTIAVGDIRAGDILSGSGNFNESTHAITVSQVNDVSFTGRNTADIQSQISRLLELVQQLQAQLQALQGH